MTYTLCIMHKLFSPKDYTFLGLVFGVPTALYAGFRNGIALKDTHPEVLQHVKKALGIFAVLLVVVLVVDAWNVGMVVAGAKEIVRGTLGGSSLYQPYGYGEAGAAFVRATQLRFSLTSWGFLIAQLALLIFFVKGSKRMELPVYESLKRDGQVSPRSNAELVVFGVGMWILFWLYGQAVAVVLQALMNMKV